ncbi:MAG TPA: hypothetical protein DDW28_10725 [Prevotella sp.]|nr:hypothetical protein [uncultured Prevotella sp.]HBF06516.1 hypothetical protein [Candidatus Segatella violae]
MRKVFLFLVVSVCVLLSLGSCGKKELKNVRGLVKSVQIDNDTIRSLTVVCGEDSMIFNLDSARYNEGIMVPADSVIVDYIDGKGDTAIALVVTVLPRAAKIIQQERH